MSASPRMPATVRPIDRVVAATLGAVGLVIAVGGADEFRMDRMDASPSHGSDTMPDREAASPRDDAVRVGHTTPILRVADLEASLVYYADALGFTLAFRVGAFAQVERDDAAIMLCEGSQGHAGTWMYVGVSDADALAEELRHRGARIRHGPVDYPWGSRELHVFDPDGHVLRFGSESDHGARLGDWLDEAGRRWSPQPDGSWREVEPA